ncbi:MAG: hypothetical protein V4689_06665 [Verrucomicrobiota bacterium]
MIRIKTHYLPLISALFVSAAMPLGAQISLSLSSKISYRQDKKSINFKGGSFDMDLVDGHVDSIFGCNDPNYFPPGYYIGICSPGTAGFLSSGSINGATIQRPYLVVTSLYPAIAIEPFKPQFVSLSAAPASGLPRPSGGFKDDSATVYYNLNTTSIQEYKITHYFLEREYAKSQRTKFTSEIVPGVYQYVFPAVDNSPSEDYVFRPAPISATIYPMVEGLANVNNTEQGVVFTSINNNKWSPKGFIELSYFRPNVIKWKGMNPDTVFAAVDNLYFSLRALRDPKNPQGSALVEREAMFPAFDNGGDSRVLLTSPYQTSFTVPPIFPSGMRAMVELQLQRDFQTGGVTYDFSSRKFQIPVMVVNRYTEYTDINFAKARGKDILSDPDKDGFNNLNEWILGSNGNDFASTPEPPTPAPYQAVNIVGGPTPIGSYYGFNVNVQTATNPKVAYLLQRSTDQGKTWQKFTEDDNWTVDRVTNVERNIVTTQIQVRSKIMVPDEQQVFTNPNWYIQPPGTLSDIYRVKITLKKNK